MDDVQASRFPYLSWLTFQVSGATANNPLVMRTHGACCSISVTLAGQADVRWITRGREQRWTEFDGVVHVVPADNEQHTFVARMSPQFSSAVLLVPRKQFMDFVRTEGVETAWQPQRLLAPRDTILRSCVVRVLADLRQGGPALNADLDEAARRLILRIIELSGGGRPDWHGDASVFDRQTLAMLVTHADEHLRSPPTLSDMAMLVGLSPSHFARKFRASTGLSLQRFINRRRVRASLTMLSAQSQPVAHVALDLGFSSQSHFTRIFRELTGMTPARYRKQFKRSVGWRASAPIPSRRLAPPPGS